MMSIILVGRSTISKAELASSEHKIILQCYYYDKFLLASLLW